MVGRSVGRGGRKSSEVTRGKGREGREGRGRIMAVTCEQIFLLSFCAQSTDSDGTRPPKNFPSRPSPFTLFPHFLLSSPLSSLSVRNEVLSRCRGSWRENMKRLFFCPGGWGGGGVGGGMAVRCGDGGGGVEGRRGGGVAFSRVLARVCVCVVFFSSFDTLCSWTGFASERTKTTKRTNKRRQNKRHVSHARRDERRGAVVVGLGILKARSEKEIQQRE